MARIVIYILMCSIFSALIGCMKCAQEQHMHLNFTDVPFLHYGREHVLAICVPIFRVISMRNKNTVEYHLRCLLKADRS